MQDNLARALQVVSRAVSTRNTLPVLANVLLKTEDAGLKLTATNLEIGVTYWVPGRIDVLPQLPKNANGKIDRTLLKARYR